MIPSLATPAPLAFSTPLPSGLAAALTKLHVPPYIPGVYREAKSPLKPRGQIRYIGMQNMRFIWSLLLVTLFSMAY
jgi:hypothetical protein